MTRPAKDKHFIKKPTYPGGAKGLHAFVRKHLIYPESARADKIQGDVLLRYGINQKGNVTEVKIISGLSPDCDKEAERVVRLLKFDVSKQYKARVLFHKKLRIQFKAPPETLPTAEPSTKVRYSYSISSRPKPQKIDRQSKTATRKASYTYTITRT